MKIHKTKTAIHKMGSGKMNIRFLWYHLMVDDLWGIKIEYNEYHRGLPDGIFQIHQFKPFRK